MMRRIALLLAGLAVAAGAAAAEPVNHRSMWIGGDLEITRSVEGPVLAIGGDVTVNAPVTGAVRVAGGTVTLGSDAAVMGDVSIAAGTLDIEGPILGDLHAAAGDMRINGQVTGDASIAAGSLVLGPHARIEGHLHFRGSDLVREPGSQVLGGVARSERHRHWQERAWTDRFSHGWFWTVLLVLFAALIAAALPDASQRMARELRERPWVTPLLGLLALFCIPVAAVLLMITVIGIPVAVLGLAFYAALLLVGYVWLAVVVGGMLLDRVSPEAAARTAGRVGAAVLAMLVLAVLVRAPFVGGLFRLVALMAGVGMIVAVVLRRSPPPEARPAV
jgi:cytoskeletal protein CcmA (bactofilin family)